MSTKRTKSQNGKRARAKGHAWEREVAHVFGALYQYADVRRCLAQTRTAAREGCDVESTPFWIECKVGARGRVNLDAALEQAERESDGRPALVVAKEDRMEPVVFTRLSTIARSKLGSEDVPILMTLARFVALLGDVR